jgi:hypothetical protein
MSDASEGVPDGPAMELPDPLPAVAALVERAPEGGVALIVYGLVKALSLDARGCVFALARLRELDEAQRTLVYALMEFYARGGTQRPEWPVFVERLDDCVRG